MAMRVQRINDPTLIELPVGMEVFECHALMSAVRADHDPSGLVFLTAGSSLQTYTRYTDAFIDSLKGRFKFSSC